MISKKKEFLNCVALISFFIGLCLSLQISEYEKIYESKKQDAYYRKKELDKLRIKELEVKEKVITSTVVRKGKLCIST